MNISSGVLDLELDTDLEWIDSINSQVIKL